MADEPKEGEKLFLEAIEEAKKLEEHLIEMKGELMDELMKESLFEDVEPFQITFEKMLEDALRIEEKLRIFAPRRKVRKEEAILTEEEKEAMERKRRILEEERRRKEREEIERMKKKFAELAEEERRRKEIIKPTPKKLVPKKPVQRAVQPEKVEKKEMRTFFERVEKKVVGLPERKAKLIQKEKKVVPLPILRGRGKGIEEAIEEERRRKLEFQRTRIERLKKELAEKIRERKEKELRRRKLEELKRRIEEEE